jgi:hypothetical protein
MSRAFGLLDRGAPTHPVPWGAADVVGDTLAGSVATTWGWHHPVEMTEESGDDR